MNFRNLSPIQENILFASIIADGEITKCYPSSRRKNNSYREHYGVQQEAYRRWKASFYDGQLYILSKSNCLVSKSDPYFTKLYSHFYNQLGSKKIPLELLSRCILPHFLTILYLDDGSLCITKRINFSKKLIYLLPSIYLYLQNYPEDELIVLQKHISKYFGFNFKINKRKDGYGHILRLSTVSDSLKFLETIKEYSAGCPEMEYKYDWTKRLQMEREKLLKVYPDFQILPSDSNRWRDYTKEEITTMILLKKEGKTNQQIADELQRSYWSIVYKFKDIRKDGLL